MSIRPVLFWTHLIAGVSAGVVILVMSVTGVLLTYEKQMVALAERLPAAAGHKPVEPKVAAPPPAAKAASAAPTVTH